MKPLSQRKHKVVEEKKTVIDEEVQKLASLSFIIEVKYPSWLANIVLVRKALNKWCMCINFIELNVACWEGLYPFPNIDRLIDESPGYKMMSLIDAYSRYN